MTDNMARDWLAENIVFPSLQNETLFVRLLDAKFAEIATLSGTAGRAEEEAHQAKVSRMFRALNGLDIDDIDAQADVMLRQAFDGVTVGPPNRLTLKGYLAEHLAASKERGRAEGLEERDNLRRNLDLAQELICDHEAVLAEARGMIDMLTLCGEEECRDVEGLPQKLRALIDGLIEMRRQRDDAAQQAVRECARADRYRALASDPAPGEQCPIGGHPDTCSAGTCAACHAAYRAAHPVEPSPGEQPRKLTQDDVEMFDAALMKSVKIVAEGVPVAEIERLRAIETAAIALRDGLKAGFVVCASCGLEETTSDFDGLAELDAALSKGPTP